jgi:deoxyguanosine kinase
MYICIEGNIGSGKSTIAKELASKLNATFLPEQFEENTLLPLFYLDKKTFAFPTEYSFLIERQKQLSSYFSFDKKKKITISDYHFDKCICFAKTNLSKNDFTFFKKHFKPLKNTVPIPDLVVYLDTEISNLKKNVRLRGRGIEKDLKESYLVKLKKNLDKYYKINGDIKTTVLILTIKEYNKSTIKNCCDEILNTIKQLNK